MVRRYTYIFKTVCECQSITAAAGKLNMTQPAVSVAIKELESFYQVKLFERMNRTIYLTEAGNTLKGICGSYPWISLRKRRRCCGTEAPWPDAVWESMYQWEKRFSQGC